MKISEPETTVKNIDKKFPKQQCWFSKKSDDMRTFAS